MWAWRYTVGPQLYILTRPGSSDLKASLWRVSVLYRASPGPRRRPSGRPREAGREADRPPLADLSAMLALPADLDVGLAPDDDGDREGVLEGFFPPLLVLVHSALLELDAAFSQGRARRIARRAVPERVHDDGAHWGTPAAILAPAVGFLKGTVAKLAGSLDLHSLPAPPPEANEYEERSHVYISYRRRPGAWHAQPRGDRQQVRRHQPHDPGGRRADHQHGPRIPGAAQSAAKR